MGSGGVINIEKTKNHHDAFKLWMATAYRTVFDTQNGTDRQTHTQAELFLFSDDAMENENKYEDGGFFEKKMKK